MNGQVYVFNVYSQSLTLSLNGISIAAGDIPDWSSGGQQRYRPACVAVPRTLNASDGPGKFFNGRNSLFMSWLDGAFVAAVAIDGATFPLNQDLLLFVNRTNWDLVNHYGVQSLTGSVMPAGWLRDALASVADDVRAP